MEQNHRKYGNVSVYGLSKHDWILLDISEMLWKSWTESRWYPCIKAQKSTLNHLLLRTTHDFHCFRNVASLVDLVVPLPTFCDLQNEELIKDYNKFKYQAQRLKPSGENERQQRESSVWILFRRSENKYRRERRWRRRWRIQENIHKIPF